jgi:hypothetical protein
LKPRPEPRFTTPRICGRSICPIGKSPWGSAKRFWCRLAEPALSTSANRERVAAAPRLVAWIFSILPFLSLLTGVRRHSRPSRRLENMALIIGSLSMMRRAPSCSSSGPAGRRGTDFLACRLARSVSRPQPTERPRYGRVFAGEADLLGAWLIALAAELRPRRIICAAAGPPEWTLRTGSPLRLPLPPLQTLTWSHGGTV